MTIKTISPEILQSKHHFELLDGLRGVAALAIVCFHFMEVAYPDAINNFIGHGFLAVDFFFCLSGFVIAYAYDDRIEKMGLVEFFKSRIIRLHPLVILGTVLGLLAFLFDPFGGSAHTYSAGRIFLIFLSSIFLIPLPIMEDRFFNLFGLNAPAWSLFWEYVANIAYALILVKLTRNILLALAVLAAGSLCYVAFSSGSLLGGWGGSTFWHGGARIAYSFLAGMLIFRFNLIIKSKIGFLGLSTLLLFAFLMPFSWGWQAQLAVVLLYFPLIIMLGAGARVSEGLKKLCKFSGDISYPLYMTHYSVIFMFLNYYTAVQPTTAQLVLIIITGMILLIGVAYVAMVAFDIPVRRYLNSKRKKIG
ncbi:acyltransferase family protein [Pedobacter sp.]|uniref:acyltransferase family protein n=1 Tax=Pedobacter sp. TaxID=1411316 RepID=UPI003D7F94BA